MDGDIKDGEGPSNIRSMEDARNRRGTQGKSSSWVQAPGRRVDTEIRTKISQADRITKLERIMERQTHHIEDLYRKLQEARSTLYQLLQEIRDKRQ